MDNLQEMAKFLDAYHQARLNHQERKIYEQTDYQQEDLINFFKKKTSQQMKAQEQMTSLVKCLVDFEQN